MKVQLKDDHILKIGDEGVEVGEIPKGVGLNRLRFNGKELVDISQADSIWVRPLPNGGFSYHCIEVPGSHLLPIPYRERKKVTMEGGIPRVRVEKEEGKKPLRPSEELRELVMTLIRYTLNGDKKDRDVLEKALSLVDQEKL